MTKEPDRSQRKALGKGLSALLPSRNKASDIHAPSVPEAAQQGEIFRSIPLKQIQPDRNQPRGRFDDEKLAELAQSIRSLGVIQPITVRAVASNQYRIVAGERRWRAAELAGLTELPALVRTVAGQQLLELALIENIQREDLNPIEIALAFERLAVDHHLNHEQIAQKTGKDRSTVTNFLRLLKLSESVRQDLISGALTMGHARALVNVADPEEQKSLADSIKQRQLSVRETESLVRRLTDIHSSPESSARTAAKKMAEEIDPNIRAAIEEMSMALGTKVKLVARGAQAGRLEIEYYSSDDLDRIYSVIVKT